MPVPVTAINADSLVNNNQLRLQDYYTRIPGLNLFQGIYGEPVIAIRGVTAAYGTNTTIGTVVDDIPYGSSTRGFGYSAPDIDPSELQRIEVLRGPQGTLYGASSIGGLLKYVTVDPSTEQLSGRLQAGISSVSKGDDAAHSVRGSINLPLGDTFAVRASGFSRRDPGYIDNTVTGQQDINSGDAKGGRVAMLWRASDVFSAKLSAVVQEQERDGSAYAYLLPAYTDLQQGQLRGTGWLTRKSAAYSATLTARLGKTRVDLAQRL